MSKIIINLNSQFHDKPSEEVKVDDILWMSGKSYVEGCSVALRDRRVLRSTDNTTDIKAAIDLAKREDNEPRRG